MTASRSRTASTYDSEVRVAAIILDGEHLEAEEGSNLLLVALEHGVFIPHLCCGQR